MSHQGGTMLFFLKAWKLNLTPRIHLCTVKTVKKTMFGQVRTSEAGTKFELVSNSAHLPSTTFHVAKRRLDSPSFCLVKTKKP